MFGQGLVKLQERRGEKRAGSWALLQASTRREPATSTARVSSTRVSKQTLHASPLEHLRGGETAIEALTVLSTRALAMEGAWGVTAGCSAAPGPGARLPSIPGTWRQGGEVSGGGEYPKRRGGGRRHSSRERYGRGKVLGSDPHAGGRAVLEVFGPQETDGDDAISGLWRFFNELDVTWPVQAVLSS